MYCGSPTRPFGRLVAATTSFTQLRVVTEKGVRRFTLVAQSGARDIDDPSPVITIMFPDEN